MSSRFSTARSAPCTSSSGDRLSKYPSTRCLPLHSTRRFFLWDVVFYGSFALVVTSSVRIAGVLLVFSYLIVPAALAGLFTPGLRQRLVLAWVLGAVLTAAGLYASWTWDLPTGPAIVTAFGAATALVALGFSAQEAYKEKSRDFRLCS